jgi:hypothetical protein
MEEVRVQDLRKTHGVLPTVHKQVVLLIQRTIEVVALSEHRILPSFIMCYPSFNGMVRYCHSNYRSHVITFSYSQVFMVYHHHLHSVGHTLWGPANRQAAVGLSGASGLHTADSSWL